MQTTTRQLANLVTGQMVALANDSRIGIVIRREAHNLYLIDHPAAKQPMLLGRCLLCTYDAPSRRWLAGRNASQLSPAIA